MGNRGPISGSTIRQFKPRGPNQALADAPPPPADLAPAAAQEWRIVAAALVERHTLRPEDLALLRAYVAAVAELRTLEAVISELGPILETLTGAGPAYAPNPAVRAASAVAARMRDHAKDLGIHPANRARLGEREESAPTSEKSDLLELLIRGKGGRAD